MEKDTKLSSCHTAQRKLLSRDDIFYDTRCDVKL